MNSRLLSQFIAVANAGTITGASRQLNIAQPALSHAIATLEKDLGIRLFHRHRRGVELTDAGSILFERARPILDSLEAARLAVREADPAPSGNVSIAMPGSVAYVLARPLYEIVRAQYRRIHLDIEDALTGHLPRWLRTGRSDLIVRFDAADDTEFRSEPIFREDLYLVGTGIGRDLTIRFLELQNHAMFLPDPQHGMGRAIARYEEELGIALDRLPLSAAVHPVLSLVESGAGCAILPWSIVFDKVGKNGLRARKIVDPDVSRTAYLSRRRSGPYSSAVAAVGEAVLESTRQVHAEKKWHGEYLATDSRAERR
jgi:LysR family nitrogen assimilation transcriptional regulator